MPVSPIAQAAVQSVGNADLFHLLSRTVIDGATVTVKAMPVARGCVIHTATQIRNQDGSHAVSESLCFVSDMRLEPDTNFGFKLIPER